MLALGQAAARPKTAGAVRKTPSPSPSRDMAPREALALKAVERDIERAQKRLCQGQAPDLSPFIASIQKCLPATSDSTLAMSIPMLHEGESRPTYPWEERHQRQVGGRHTIGLLRSDPSDRGVAVAADRDEELQSEANPCISTIPRARSAGKMRTVQRSSSSTGGSATQIGRQLCVSEMGALMGLHQSDCDGRHLCPGCLC
mmetsp:Transcript_51171/g.108740  ORF Transcript_51171/g.108740 Transcript_51171/m.108740 type:complete len:201 (-) Transcript_51171:130-732(-)